MRTCRCASSRFGLGLFTWKFLFSNSPTASPIGGVWERQIRTAKGILDALFETHGKCLDSESLHTLLVEIKAIVNSRLITAETISDIKSDIPLQPDNLLTMESKVIIPPLGCFSAAGIYSQKLGRRVYFEELVRKLSKTWKINFRNGKIVLLKAENHRSDWPVVSIIETFEI